jgi:hypothetical protein
LSSLHEPAFISKFIAQALAAAHFEKLHEVRFFLSAEAEQRINFARYTHGSASTIYILVRKRNLFVKGIKPTDEKKKEPCKSF